MAQIYKLLIITILFFSCQHNEVMKLQAEVDMLTLELDNCKFGAEKLYKYALSYKKNGQYEESRKQILKLMQKHPKSSQALKSEPLLKEINELIENKNLKKEAERAAKEAVEKKRRQKALKNMRKKHDDMNDITWYRDKSSPIYSNVNGLFCYFGVSKKEPLRLRFRIQYKGENWLFINSYLINVDGVKYEMNADGISRDNDNGIWEWIDILVFKDELEIIKAISKGKKVKIRHIGDKYYKDRIITNREKQALRNVLDAYQAIGGEL